MGKIILNLRKLVKLLLIVSMIIIFSAKSNSQTLQRQSIGCAGTFTNTGGIVIQQTVGQPYSTTTSYTDNVIYRPGFQQPVLKINVIHSTISLNLFPNPATNYVTI